MKHESATLGETWAEKYLREHPLEDECYVEAAKELKNVAREIQATRSETRVPIAHEFAEFIGRLSDLAHMSSFWLEKPYGNRLYYGIGAGDYIAKDVLHAFLHALKATPSATPMPERVLIVDDGISIRGAALEAMIAEEDRRRTVKLDDDKHGEKIMPWAHPVHADTARGYIVDANGNYVCPLRASRSDEYNAEIAKALNAYATPSATRSNVAEECAKICEARAVAWDASVREGSEQRGYEETVLMECAAAIRREYVHSTPTKEQS